VTNFLRSRIIIGCEEYSHELEHIFFIAKLSKWSKKWIEKFVKSLMKCKQTQNPDEKVVGKN
jgi:hypothetical protein